MFFNRTQGLNISFLKVSIIGLMISGCGLSLNEAPQKEKPVELQNISTTCLDDSISTIKNMFKGEAQDQEVSPAFDCISNTVDSFTTNIIGENKDYFTPTEVVYFLNKNFIKSEKKIPENLVLEIMKLKVSLVGGSSDILLKTELKKINEIIQILNPEFANLNPHLKILTNNWEFSSLNSQEKDAQFASAKLALLKFSNQLGQSFTEIYTEYNINSLLDLVITAMEYGDASAEQIANIEKYRGIAQSVKSNLINNSLIVKNKDWPVVTKTLSETLFLILRNNYYGKVYNQNFNLRPENKLSKQSYLINDVALAVSEVLEMQNDRTVTYEQMSSIFNEVFKTFEIDITFDVETLKSITLVKNATTVTKLNNTLGWTKTDFLNLHNVIDVFIHEIGIIHSEIKLMSNDEIWKTVFSKFIEHENSSKISVKNVSKIFVGKYDLRQLKNFLEALVRSKLIKSETLIKDYDKYYNTILAAQNLINSNSGTVLQGKDLINLLNTGIGGYFHFLEYKNFVDIYKIDQIEFNLNAKSLIPKVIQTLNQTIQSNPTQFLSTENLIKTYRSAVTDFEWESFMTDSSLKITLDFLWTNVLIEPNRRLNGDKLKGLDNTAIEQLVKIINNYLTSNILSIKALDGKNEYTQSEYLQKLNELLNLNSDPTERLLLNEMLAATNSPIPMALEKDFLKILDPKSSVYTKESVETSNLSRLISRILIQSITLKKSVLNQISDPANYQSAFLDIDELQSLFELIRPVLIEKDFVGEDNLKFMKSRFLESDLFTVRSNGNDKSDFLEIHDIAIHLIAGTARAKIIKDQIISNCLDTVTPPYNRKTEINELCLIQVYSKFNEGFEFVPSYLQAKIDYSLIPITNIKNKFEDFSLNLLISAGHEVRENQTVFFEDADNYPHVVQYVEMMYARFDTNRDGLLTNDEALKAFPVFRSVIQKAAEALPGKTKEEELPGIFMFFLEFGRAPTKPEAIPVFGKFSKYIKSPEKWNVNTDRHLLSSAFKVLAN